MVKFPPALCLKTWIQEKIIHDNHLPPGFGCVLMEHDGGSSIPQVEYGPVLSAPAENGSDHGNPAYPPPSAHGLG